MSTSEIDFQEVAEWFGVLYRNSRGWLHVASSGDWVGRFFDLRNGFIPPACYVEQLGRTSTTGIYTRVTSLTAPPVERGRRGGASLTASLPALWADLDLAGPGHRHAGPLPLPPDENTARRIIASIPIPEPSLWITSGGGLYPMWLLHPVHHIADDLDWVQDVSARWQRVIAASAERAGFHYGSGVGDLARVLRIPGTINRKTDEPRRCRILGYVDPTGYSLRSLAAALEVAERELPLPETPPTPTRPAAEPRPDGDVRPGDDFAARTDWGDRRFLLGRLGWTSVVRRGMYREWLRADAGSGSTLSATTGKGGGDNLYVFSTETPFPTNVPISKLEAFRIIHGHATHRDAVRALSDLGFGTPPTPRPTLPPALAPLDWPAGSTRVRP